MYEEYLLWNLNLSKGFIPSFYSFSLENVAVKLEVNLTFFFFFFQFLTSGHTAIQLVPL